MGERLLRRVLYGLARLPSLAFLALTFAAAVYIIVRQLPFVLILPFVALTLAVLTLMVWDTLGSRTLRAEALSRPLSTAGLKAKRLRDYVERADEYRRELREASPATEPASSDVTMVETAAVSVERLCRMIDRFERDRVLARDLARLESKKTRTPAEDEQLRTLHNLQQRMQQAEQQVLALLATLGESYAAGLHLETISETDGAAPEVLDRLRNRTQVLHETAQELEGLYQGTLSTIPKGAQR